MKAPEKIYIQSFNTSEEDAKFDKSKMFFDDIWTEEPETGFENIEYTRTDVFIKKVCDAYEVKEVDLEKEIENYLSTYWHEEKELHPFLGHMAKHFFELGTRVNNPITTADRGTEDKLNI